jgi:hypothetical protein
MKDVIDALKDTPIPTILVLAGLFFLLLSFVNELGGVIKPQPNQKRLTIPLGLLLLTLGLVLNSTHSSPPVLSSGGVTTTQPSQPSTFTPTPSPSIPIPSPSVTPTATLSPSSSSSTKEDDEIWNQKTLQTQVDYFIKWELKACKRDQDNVGCYFLVTSDKDLDVPYRIAFNTTKIVEDTNGREHNPNVIQVVDQGIASQNNGEKPFNVTQGIPYKVIIDFTDVSSSVGIKLLRVTVGGTNINGARLDFKDIPVS